VPPGRPPASLTTQPARYSPLGSEQAGRSHFAFFGRGAEPDHVHKTETVDQDGGGESRVDGTNLLGDQLQVEVADTAAAILFGQEAHCQTAFIGFDIGRFGLGEGLMRIRGRISVAYQRRQDRLGKVTCRVA
jgi:hypothetical protein